MAEGDGYEPLPQEDPFGWGDDNADQTTPFFPNGASTPYQTHSQEEIGMKSFQKSDRPETSYAETSFGGVYYDDLTKRFDALKRDGITGLLNTKGIPNVENSLGYEERQAEIERVRQFIKSRYPEAKVEKLVISFSSKKNPMDSVV